MGLGQPLSFRSRRTPGSRSGLASDPTQALDSLLAPAVEPPNLSLLDERMGAVADPATPDADGTTPVDLQVLDTVIKGNNGW